MFWRSMACSSATELHLGDHGGAGIHELGMQPWPPARVELEHHLPISPAVAHGDGPVGRAQAEDDVDGAGQDAGGEGVGVENEPDLDLVDPRSPEHVVGIGVQHREVAGVPRSDTVGPRPQVVVQPER